RTAKSGDSPSGRAPEARAAESSAVELPVQAAAKSSTAASEADLANQADRAAFGVVVRSIWGSLVDRRPRLAARSPRRCRMRVPERKLAARTQALKRRRPETSVGETTLQC